MWKAGPNRQSVPGSKDPSQPSCFHLLFRKLNRSWETQDKKSSQFGCPAPYAQSSGCIPHQASKRFVYKASQAAKDLDLGSLSACGLWLPGGRSSAQDLWLLSRTPGLHSLSSASNWSRLEDLKSCLAEVSRNLTG